MGNDELKSLQRITEWTMEASRRDFFFLAKSAGVALLWVEG